MPLIPRFESVIHQEGAVRMCQCRSCAKGNPHGPGAHAAVRKRSKSGLAAGGQVLTLKPAVDVEVGAHVIDELLSNGRKRLVGKPRKAKGGIERLLKGYGGKVVC